MEGHVQGITTPEGQDNQSVPLPHASHGPAVAPQRLRLPHSGEDIEAMHQPALVRRRILLNAPVSAIL